MTTAETTFSSLDGLELEGVIAAPAEPRAILVLCHPHPKMGGTMNAPLLLAVQDDLLADGWAVLRFNFRGIGGSEGEPSLGIEEQQDARGALAEARERFPRSPVAIAGWSFGAAVAVRVASGESDLVACVAIAPAVKEKPGITAGLPPPQDLDLRMPSLFIVGENDDLVAPQDCAAFASTVGGTFVEMKAANHFFWGRYERLAEEVRTFLDGALG